MPTTNLDQVDYGTNKKIVKKEVSYLGRDFSDIRNNLIEFAKSIDPINRSLREADILDQSDSIKFARRGLYLKKDIKAGEKITRDHLIPLRPLLNFISPIHWEEIIGKRVVKNMNEGEGIKMTDFS